MIVGYLAGIVAKTPSSVVKFSATASCASTKKPKPQFDVTKSLKNKPTYKPHSGIIIQCTCPRTMTKPTELLYATLAGFH